MLVSFIGSDDDFELHQSNLRINKIKEIIVQTAQTEQGIRKSGTGCNQDSGDPARL
jgi:hypothetical protein